MPIPKKKASPAPRKNPSSLTHDAATPKGRSTNPLPILEEEALARRRNLRASHASLVENPPRAAPTGTGGSTEAAEATAATEEREATVTAASTPGAAPSRTAANTHPQASPGTSPNAAPHVAADVRCHVDAAQDIFEEAHPPHGPCWPQPAAGLDGGGES